MTKTFLILSLISTASLFLTAQAKSLQISEIMANPIGKDKGKEWIEFFNEEKNEQNLTSYQVRINQKEYQLKGTIAPNKFTSFTMPIPNLPSTITLHKEQLTIQTIPIPASKEGKSYGMTAIRDLKNKKEKFLWLWQEPSQNDKNQGYFELTGIITANPQIDKEFFLKINQEKILMNYEYFQKIKDLVEKGDSVKALVSRQNQKMHLEQIRILNKKQPKPIKEKSKTPPYTEITIIIFILSGIYLLQNQK